jgi:arginase
MTRFVVVPQWQGSPAARGMLLRDGAEAISGDLPRARTIVLDVPLEAGDAQGTGIARLSAIRRVAAQVDDALAAQPADERIVLIGGDCSISVAAASRLAGEDLAVVWIDAHGDLNDAQSSPSGAFAGMALRAIVGGVPEAAEAAVSPGRVLLVGARDLDVAESAFVIENGVTTLAPEDLVDPDALVRAVRATGASRAYVHVDLDAIDPAEMTGTLWAVPFGIPVAALTAALARLAAEVPVAGATIAGFAPVSPEAAVDDLGAILRIVGALA